MRGTKEINLVGVTLHQGSTLSPCLFASIIDYLTDINDGDPWCMLFLNGVVVQINQRPMVHVVHKWHNTN